MRRPDPHAFLPLTAIAFEVLLSLADGTRHGYAMMRDIADRTDGRIQPNAGTLYRVVARLVDTGLIAERDAPPAEVGEDARRRYYELTALGRAVVAVEAERLAAAVAAARARNVLPHAGPA